MDGRAVQEQSQHQSKAQGHGCPLQSIPFHRRCHDSARTLKLIQSTKRYILDGFSPLQCESPWKDGHNADLNLNKPRAGVLSGFCKFGDDHNGMT
jgi:hypothetical protein